MTHDERPLERDTAVPRGLLDIDALLDGEAVDKDSLRFALDDVAARDYLIDALLLRQIAHDSGPAHFVASGTPRGPLARAARWMAASLLLAVGAGSGYAYGLHSQPRVVPATTADVDGIATPPAPEPTQIIRFEPGVNWTRQNGSR